MFSATCSARLARSLLGLSWAFDVLSIRGRAKARGRVLASLRLPSKSNMAEPALPHEQLARNPLGVALATHQVPAGRASQGVLRRPLTAGVDLMRLVPTTGPPCACALVGGPLEPETDPYAQLAEWSPCADGQKRPWQSARERALCSKKPRPPAGRRRTNFFSQAPLRTASDQVDPTPPNRSRDQVQRFLFRRFSRARRPIRSSFYPRADSASDDCVKIHPTSARRSRRALGSLRSFHDRGV